MRPPWLDGIEGMLSKYTGRRNQARLVTVKVRENAVVKAGGNLP